MDSFGEFCFSIESLKINNVDYYYTIDDFYDYVEYEKKLNILKQNIIKDLDKYDRYRIEVCLRILSKQKLKFDKIWKCFNLNYDRFKNLTFSASKFNNEMTDVLIMENVSAQIIKSTFFIELENIIMLKERYLSSMILIFANKL
jgi:hypothetical protein